MEEVTKKIVSYFRNSKGLSKLIGSSPAFLKVVSQIPVISKGDATVLISGETGSGKELIARAIHYCGDRAPYPFIPLNCGLLTDTLIETALFGHERGAFTDAKARRSGLISQASKGTLFLDEIDSLSPRGQVSLLRVLQDKTFRALGGTYEQKVDVRFVAATNASLAQSVEAGTFRADLYYRLCVFSLNLPALRHRREDILTLANYFLKKYNPPDIPLPGFSESASASLLAHDWPGNVRELENAVLRAIQFCQNNVINVEDIGLTSAKCGYSPYSVQGSAESCSYKALKKRVLDTFEREYLTGLMTRYKGNVSQAAKAAEKERRDFGRLLKKHQLEPKDFAINR